MPLSSIAPRPYKYPSLITAPNGSTVQRDLSTGTVSRCATSSRAFEGSGTTELRRRATTALRPGAKSRISGLMPSFCSTPATYLAASCSFPGGLDVLILIRSASQTSASLRTAVASATGDMLAVFTGVACGIPCAAAGTLAAKCKAAAAAIACPTTQFRFTNPPSSANGLHPAKVRCREHCLQQRLDRRTRPANVLLVTCFILTCRYGDPAR